jgi:hypothetical protein
MQADALPASRNYRLGFEVQPVLSPRLHTRGPGQRERAAIARLHAVVRGTAAARDSLRLNADRRTTTRPLTSGSAAQ